MLERIDLYCERLGSGFWVEPVNAWSNLFFFVAAWFAWKEIKRRNVASPGAWLLVGALLAIGSGSFLFHTFATSWAELADVLPIMLFQFSYVWLYTREVGGVGRAGAGGFLLAYFAASMLAARFPHVLNGSLAYVPSLVVLVLLGTYHAATRKKGRCVLLAAAGLFLVSLAFRTLDNILCPCFPLGVHFLWHACNAAMLLLALHAWLANRPARRLSHG